MRYDASSAVQGIPMAKNILITVTYLKRNIEYFFLLQFLISSSVDVTISSLGLVPGPSGR